MNPKGILNRIFKNVSGGNEAVKISERSAYIDIKKDDYESCQVQSVIDGSDLLIRLEFQTADKSRTWRASKLFSIDDPELDSKVIRHGLESTEFWQLQLKKETCACRSCRG